VRERRIGIYSSRQYARERKKEKGKEAESIGLDEFSTAANENLGKY
jgi:hypothetical protein